MKTLTDKKILSRVEALEEIVSDERYTDIYRLSMTVIELRNLRDGLRSNLARDFKL